MAPHSLDGSVEKRMGQFIKNGVIEKVKVREFGLVVGRMPTGAKNCITDVSGVRVGHVTLHEPLGCGRDEHVCTGVTAILPHGGNLFREKVIATSYVFNGFGKSTGLIQVNELGRLEAPIMLTNTFSVPAVTEGTLRYMLASNPEIGESTGTINIVVGECNDSYLNSIRELSVRPRHAKEAIRHASTQRADEGAVGAGTGMICFGYKGGIGCSSRLVTTEAFNETYTVGGLVLSNFGSREELAYSSYMSRDARLDTPCRQTEQSKARADGSIIIVLATDAPLNERQLLRVAKRCGIGLGRAGSHMSHGSGDIVIAFSTAQTVDHFTDDRKEDNVQIREDKPIMNALFTAAAEVTEEAIYNSLSQAVTTVGRKGRRVEALPLSFFNSKEKGNE